MREHLELYVASLRDRMAAGTIRGMREQLLRFVKSAEALGVVAWSDVDASFLQSWVASLLKRGVSARTVEGYVSNLRQFFRWLVRENLVLVNPVADGLSGPVYRPVISPPEVAVVAAAIDRVDVSRHNAERNRAMMELMYLCGLRRAEVASLDLRDVRGDEMRVCGKGRKERLVPLGESVSKALLEYMSGERAMIVGRFGECEALFLSMYGGRMGVEAVYAALKYSMRSKISPHMLRRACATHMLRNGAPVEVLQRLLGHDRLSTTEFYTDVTGEDLRREMLNKHPGW
jgi:site-specific recombinase XerD